MSEYEDPAAGRRDEKPEEASVHLAKWTPWIWLVPILAIFFVGWLVVRYGFFGGGDITVRFAEARGLDRYSPVRFRGAKVGTVQKITIDDDLGQVIVRISMDASMNHALRTGTRFWIVEPGLEGGGIGGLLSGTHVGIAPGDGDPTREFIGQEFAPVLFAPEAGSTFILEDKGLGSVSIGAPVVFQGMRVGRVLGTEYDEKRESNAIHVFVAQRFAGYVRQSTRFYRAGGLNFSLGGGGLSMGDASLSSLLNAPVGFYTPEVLAGAPVPERTRFELYPSRSIAIASSDGPHLTYMTYIPGPVHGLSPGTPVQMKGVQIGRVRDVRLRYLASSESLETPVIIEVDPRLLEIEVNESTTREDLRMRMNQALASLIRKGMRAGLATSLVLPGASAVSLEMTGTPGTGQLIVTHDPPIIPAAAGGSGIEGALSSLTDVATTIRNLPLQEIAGDMRSAAQRVNTLAGDPRFDESLNRMTSALRQIEEAAATANTNVEPIALSLRNAAESAESAARTIQSVASSAEQNVDPIVESLRNAADSAEAAAKSAEGLLGGPARQNYDIAALIRELTRAAEAVRALSNYLTENPDSLLKGRRE